MLLYVFIQKPLAELPDYPAVVLAFLIAVVLPGAVLQRALFAGDTDPFVRLAAAPALGLALAAVPGFIALELHQSLSEFAVIYASFAATICGISLFFSPGNEESNEAEVPDAHSPGLFLSAILVTVALAGVLFVPIWAKGDVSANFDTWAYMAYVQDYIGTDSLNADEPILGTGEDVNPRMRSNVWVLTEALITDIAGVTPHDTLVDFLPPILIVFASLAMYALTRSLFGSASIAVLAMAFQLGHAALDLAPHEGYGGNLLLRVSEDKMAATFLLLPIGLMFVTRFFERRSAATYIGTATVTLAIVVVHPMPLVFLAASIVGLAIFRTLQQRSSQPGRQAAILLLPIVIMSLWPFFQRQLLIGQVPEIWDTATRFREMFHFTTLGSGFLIVNYHVFLHPLVILATLLAPVVWLKSRAAAGTQLALGMTAMVLVLSFFPPASTTIAKVLAPQTLWRVPWLLPVAPVLAYATYVLFDRLRATRILSPLKGRVVGALAPATAAILLLAGAFFLQEHYRGIDGGAFYNWEGPNKALPWTQDSIMLDGYDRAFSGSWRVKEFEAELFAFLQSAVPAESVLLVEPRNLGHKIPGMLTDIYPVDFVGVINDPERRRDAEAFARGELSDQEIRGVIDRYGVDYIVVTEVGEANRPLVTDAGLYFQWAIGPYVVYEVIK